MRDKFVNKEHFVKCLARLDAFNNAMPYDTLIQKFWDDKRVTPEGAKDISIITGLFLSKVLETLFVKYSLGETLESINKLHGSELFKRFEFVSDFLSKGHQEKHIFTIEGQTPLPFRLNNIFCSLAWLVCLSNDEEKLAKIAPYLGREHESRFLDVVCGYYDSGRSIGEVSEGPFYLLDVLTDVEPNDRPQIICDYLQQWPKTVDSIGSASASISLVGNNTKIRNKDDLLKCIGYSYLGYWAWEVALAVKFFHIDDSSFKDHDFYPYDLVYYSAPLDNQHYLESISGSSSGASAAEVLSSRTNKRDDLIVSIEDEASDLKALVSRSTPELNRRKFYLAYKFDSSVDEASADPILDSAVRYSGYLLSDSDELKEDFGRVSLAMALDSEFSPRHESMNVHQLVDELGEDDSLPFMEEVHLYISGDKDECEYVYASRHKENQVPPLMILRYRQKIENALICIDCMVRDESLTVADVKPHWEWLIENYRIT